jgi:Trypsin-like peptidase domain
MKISDPAIRNDIMPRLAAHSTEMLRCVVPIFQEIKGAPVQRGSGFFVFDGLTHYVVSAAHVFREARLGPLFISVGHKRIRHLTGPMLMTPGRGVPIEQDKLDVAVWQLAGLDLPPYPDVEKEPIPISLLSGEPHDEPNSLFLFVGFPHSKGGRTKSQFDHEFRGYSYTDRAAPDSVYRIAGIDPSTHTLVKFNRRRAMGVDGVVQTFPLPQGMSGSPVWRFSPNTERPVVVGVATDYKKQYGVVVAARIAAPLLMIRDLKAASMTPKQG